MNPKIDQEFIIKLVANLSGVSEEQVVKKGDLKELGFDSIMLVRLVVEIETALGTQVPQEEMINENFKSVHSICQLLARME